MFIYFKFSNLELSDLQISGWYSVRLYTPVLPRLVGVGLESLNKISGILTT
jgi:hypothetical protein